MERAKRDTSAITQEYNCIVSMQMGPCKAYCNPNRHNDHRCCLIVPQFAVVIVSLFNLAIFSGTQLPRVSFLSKLECTKKYVQ